MLPGGVGGCEERGCTAQDHPPAAVRLDEDAPPHSASPLPAIVPVASEQQEPTSLPEGPLVEILARVPYKSLCRFKCVSKPWRALCSSPDIRRRSPQTLSGFFYHNGDNSGEDTLGFRNLSGRGPPLVDPSLHFLRESYTTVFLDQVCGSLLLCMCFGRRDMGEHVVCNPATEEWTVLPPIQYPGQEFDHRLDAYIGDAYIGFDAAAVPSRFLVFASLDICGRHSGKVAIYSSDTGQWSYLQSKWDSGTPVVLIGKKGVFLNGTMHWPTIHKSLLTVDSEGKVWREIQMPDDLRKTSRGISFGQSQGSLYAWQRRLIASQLYIWVLEDYGTRKWILKHTINVLDLDLFRSHGSEDDYSYVMLAIHPDCNVIFLSSQKMTVSYNLDNHKLDVICNEFMYGLPYVPCFAELPSAGHRESAQHQALGMAEHLCKNQCLLWAYSSNSMALLRDILTPMSTVWYSRLLVFWCITFVALNNVLLAKTL